MAKPLGTSAVSPGARVIGASSAARRSIPALPAVADSGSAMLSPRRGSRIFSCTSIMRVPA